MSITTIREYVLVREVERLWREPLHRNSALIIASQGFSALVGFGFWWLAARLFSPEQVGLATVLISTSTLVATLSLLGYDIGIVRFYPLAPDKRTLLNTYMTVAGAASLLVAAVYIAGLRLWSPDLLFLHSQWSYVAAFIGFTCLTTIGLLQNESFVAMRKPGMQLIQNGLGSVKLAFLPLAVAVGALGIFYVWGFTTVLLIFSGMFLLIKASPGYKPLPVVNRETVGTTLRYSFSNYVAKNLDTLPASIMPLLILSLLAVAESAYFYIPYRLSALMGTVIWGVSASLLAEASHDPSGLRPFVGKAVRFSFLFLLPLALVIILAARPILSIFGPEYSGDASVTLLRLLTLSWLPGSLNIIFVTIARVQMRNRPLIAVFGLLAALIIGGSLIAMRWLGLVGIGVVWLVSQTLTAAITLPFMFKMAKSA